MKASYFKITLRESNTPTHEARDVFVRGGDEARTESRCPPDERRVVSLIFFDRDEARSASKRLGVHYTLHGSRGESLS